jgi:3-methyladenine DNA glycosylase AlkD
VDLHPDSTIVKEVAAEINSELEALAVHNTASERAVRAAYSKKFRQANPQFILDLARELLFHYNLRWFAYELVARHKAAFQSLTAEQLEEFGQGINSWWTVDAFARTLAGPAWMKGLAPDALFHQWATSSDAWQRRAALVSTVAFNLRSQGGKGDIPRTLAVCRILAADKDDRVVKAMSWALRELVVHDPGAVRRFLAEFDAVLAARVKREVNHKLNTGLKNPRRRKSAG